MDIRIKAHAYEGKVFVLSSTGIFTEEMKDIMELNGAARKQFVGDGGYSCIINPRGQHINEPDFHGEGILCSELDIGEVVAGRSRHNIIGNYNRFDVFTLKVNRRRFRPMIVTEETNGGPGGVKLDNGDASRPETERE
jgi:predicted amidohydrolase